MKKSTTCFFIGYKDIILNDELAERLNSSLNRMIKDGVTDFYAGGELGWDMICENAVLDLKQSFPKIRLHLILSCKPDEHCKSWSSEQKAEFDRIYQAADSVEIMSKNYDDGGTKAKIARLAKLGELCICCFNNKYRGGMRQLESIVNKIGKDFVNYP